MSVSMRNSSATGLVLLAVACVDSPERSNDAAAAGEAGPPRETAVTAGPPEVLEPAFVLGADDPAPEGAPLLYGPSSIAFDPDNNLYVLDGGNHRVVKVGRTGTELDAFGRSGSGPGELASSSNNNQIVVGQDKVVYLERAISSFSVFSVGGEYADGFRLDRGVSDLAFGNGFLAVSQTSMAGPAEPTIALVGFDGQTLDSFGEPLVASTINPTDVLSLNRAAVAVGDQRVAQVFQHWPMLRIYAESGVVQTDRWFDFEWWNLPELAEWLARPKELLDDPQLQVSDEEVRPVVFWDIAYGQRSNHWYGLLAIGIVQVFDADGSPLNSYWVRDPDGNGRLITGLAVSPDESLLCTVDVLEERVACYSLR